MLQKVRSPMPEEAAASGGPASRAARTFGVTVKAVTQEADDILSFELSAPRGRKLPEFSAGAHIDVHIAPGLRRQYSLCNDPRERNRYMIAVLREPGGRGGSLAMHALRKGQKIRICGPRNHFPLAGREANFHLLLAGGIGVTPMMAMMAELEARGADYLMHYCTRSPERTAFTERLRPLIKAGKVKLHHDGGDPGRGLDINATLASYTPATHLYFCGPPGFMTAVKASVSAWPVHAVHCEYFTAPEDFDGGEKRAFKVRIKRTGQLIDVAASSSIVDALRAGGFDVETDCREGYCGTCITRYVGGEPEHRDTVLSEDERKNYVMICCARANSDVLELDL